MKKTERIPEAPGLSHENALAALKSWIEQIQKKLKKEDSEIFTKKASGLQPVVKLLNYQLIQERSHERFTNDQGKSPLVQLTPATHSANILFEALYPMLNSVFNNPEITSALHSELIAQAVGGSSDKLGPKGIYMFDIPETATEEPSKSKK